LFWTGFESGTTLNAPTAGNGNKDCYSNGCWQGVSGVDSSTGFSWDTPIYGGKSWFQLLTNDPVAPTPSTVGQWMHNELRPGEGRNGSTALYMRIDKSHCGSDGTSACGGSTQDTFHLRDFTTDPADMYISFWGKLQCDLNEKLSTPGNFWGRMYFEVKTADVGDFGPDYRYQVKIEHASSNFGGIDATKPFWQIIADRYYPDRLEFWRINVPNSGPNAVPVPLGPGCPADAPWFKFEVYWHRSSGSDGRFWAAVDGVVVADRAGANMGAANNPIDRIMRPNLYSGTPYPIFNWIDDMQIWSTFPTAVQGDAWYDPPYAPH
jgi:hypothetical protein